MHITLTGEKLRFLTGFFAYGKVNGKIILIPEFSDLTTVFFFSGKSFMQYAQGGVTHLKGKKWGGGGGLKINKAIYSNLK